MTIVRSLSKFVLEMFPLVLATVIVAVVISSLHLTSDAALARRAVDISQEPIVYIKAIPHLDRDPAPTVVAALPPADAVAVTPAETPATAATPVAAVQPTAADAVAPIKPAPRERLATAPAARARAARTVAATHANVAVAPKTLPAPKAEPVVARAEPAVVSLEATPDLAPPMPIPPMQIVSAEAQTPAAEPTRVFGMTVPASVVTVGGKVFGVARFPIEVAEVAVPSPIVRVGLKVVEKVAGAAGAAIGH